MSELVRIFDGRVVADSRDVALTFDKQHQHVLRSIDKLVKAAPELQSNFGPQLFQAPVGPGRGGVRNYRRVDMDRDGFALLAMGFTGPKALQWKLRYIEAFNRMEAALLAPVIAEAPAEPLTAVPAISFTGDQVQMIDTMHKLTASVSRIQRTHGKAEAMRAWALMGGPDLSAGTLPASCRRADDNPDAGILAWLSERIEHCPGSRVQMKVLIADYQRWCEMNQIVAQGQQIFGRNLNIIGIPSKTSDGVQRLNIRLRPAGVLQ
ncbi:Rha family transcriptional regulator [uncultured Sphingomonas sp.]|uniref:Rha family transcriptional regulator n=1 Tax=uncultured Sphingomonas sp. TaxID=158754 RepID=UPI00262E2EBF|nr:Rha family transcriptional regulator [uncultured Sphingomonas sp.]